MANKDYNFQYTPLTGRLPGNSFVKQTEQAINELAGIVNEGAAQVEVITNLANQANDNSEVALEKANEALETAGRVYITLPNLDDADNYFDSELYYFANSYSANLPVQDTGFLEVKTNDTKTAAEQVFIADTTGLCYFRHGDITSSEIGGETVYSVAWETWSSALASEDYVQDEVNTGVDTANAYTDDRYAAMKTYVDGKFESVVAKGTNYIRYESGLQMCWGAENGVTTSGKATTYPVAFKDTNYRIVTGAAGYNVSAAGTGYSNKTNTGCNLTCGSSSGSGVYYLATGYWK